MYEKWILKNSKLGMVFKDSTNCKREISVNFMQLLLKSSSFILNAIKRIWDEMNKLIK